MGKRQETERQARERTEREERIEIMTKMLASGTLDEYDTKVVQDELRYLK